MKQPPSSKDREKKRLSRDLVHMRRWLTTMPLSAGGHERNYQYIHDFSLVMAHLGCAANSRVLELGSGSCWAGEWMARLGFRVVSLDISHDMLKVGRERIEAHGRAFPSTVVSATFVAGDGEQLPFGDRSFDAVFCLNALHHIPSIATALAEVHRVLKDGGRLVLMEPGEGHSRSAESQREMEELGTLEQDILLGPLTEWATAAGFGTIRLIPSLNPKLDLPLTTRWGKPRPLWTAMLRPGFLRRELLRWNRRHVGVCLAKGHAAAHAGRLKGEIVSISLPTTIHPREMIRVEAVARNSGSAPWQCWKSFLDEKPLNQGEGGYVALGLKCQYGHMEVDTNFGRGHFLRDVQPGEELAVACLAKAPPKPGEYTLKADLVQEGVAWFEDLGGSPVTRTFRVQGSPVIHMPDSRLPERLSANIWLTSEDLAGDGRVRLTIRNSGDTLWLCRPTDEPGIPSYGRGFVRLGVQMLDAKRNVIDLNFQRVTLPHDLRPEEEVSLSFVVYVRESLPGTALVKFDMVNEEICWFESRGSSPLIVPLPQNADEPPAGQAPQEE